ncbi:membrane protein insertion efficiency factor YidD [Nocardioides marmoriginsengisoli]|uniref:Putative membrane protein insertion efficiency factor n=1 Tax=Nocardioides marmoriginsengisoli TaxID=661483 RepID=A0A3N0CBD6_9ACTN|nr:membrane protein insertion efficiency factor YidD [Nocardioides marmoriginsengisoli]RNL60748.1 membrane protein insertion efficiency factor YidD [Nocardioides marmoriginsengisoli]
MRFSPLRWILIGLLKGYRFAISPLYGQVCRYHPTCSAYALEAVSVHGGIKGSWLAVRRVASCHPWAAGGYDPVPAKATKARTQHDHSELSIDMTPASAGSVNTTQGV